jgi:hypothetical protein
MGLLSPGGVFADCLDLGNYTNWAMQDSHTIVLYRELRPIAVLEIPNCQIQSTSSIRLVKSYVCDLDNIIIDDETCSIMTVKALY